MVVIQVEVPESLAKKLTDKKVITIDSLYDTDEQTDNWQSVLVNEKATTVLTYIEKYL